MPTKILLADDSMTAQKMGKEILISAGYEVVAVSNGAAAAKKLADKYGCIILDINMPGYTGFELCEKIRANMDIAKTPVLLTIGKMEHYEPTEVQRVKADGVIIKPFEATDLIATIQKLMEKAAPPPEKTVTLEKKQVEEFKDQSYNDWKQESEPEAPKRNTIEMNHAEAAAPAFGMDMEEHFAAAAPIEAAPAMVPPAFQAPAFAEPAAATPAFDATTSLAPMESERIENLMQAPPVAMVEEQHTIPIAPPTFSAPAASGRDPMFDAPASEAGNDGYAIPVKDPALAAHVEINSPEFMAKNAPEPAPPATATDDDFEARVAAAMSSGFEEEHELVEAEPEEISEAQEEPEVAAAATVVPEPVIERTQPIPQVVDETPIYERTIKIERPADLEISAQTAMLASEDVEIAPDPMIERNYEAPVAEASQTIAEASPIVEAPIQSAPPVDAALVEQMHAAVQEMEVAPHVEEPMLDPAPAVQAVPAAAPVQTVGHDLELANALAAAVGGEAPSAMAAAATVGGKPNVTVTDPNLIAAAVHRAMAKMMPAIMSEVAKELDPEKK